MPLQNIGGKGWNVNGTPQGTNNTSDGSLHFFFEIIFLEKLIFNTADMPGFFTAR